MYSYKDVDRWLGKQSIDLKTGLERLKWSLIYASDALVDVFNLIQDSVIGRHSKALSRAVSAFLVGLILLPSFGYWVG